MLIGRLIRLAVLLALLVGAIAILLSLVVQPFVERQASSAIGKELGTKVTVDAGSVFSPGVIKGDVGPLKVHADTFKRGVIPVRNLDAKIHGGALSLGSILSGSPKLTWSSLDMTAEVGPERSPSTCAACSRPPASRERRRRSSTWRPGP